MTAERGIIQPFFLRLVAKIREILVSPFEAGEGERKRER
jgi:hypothetical protein